MAWRTYSSVRDVFCNFFFALKWADNNELNLSKALFYAITFLLDVCSLLAFFVPLSGRWLILNLYLKWAFISH
jgi:hypothetical protein